MRPQPEVTDLLARYGLTRDLDDVDGRAIAQCRAPLIVKHGLNHRPAD